MTGFGKVFYYFGKGLWVFFKLLGRGIKNAYYANQAKQKVESEQRKYFAQIEKENYHAGKGYAMGMAEVREQERLRRKDEREQRQFQKQFNKTWEVPTLKENAFFGEPPNRKKKKRSMFDF